MFDQLLAQIKRNGTQVTVNSESQADEENISREIAIICNILAMAHLHKEDFKMS